MTYGELVQAAEIGLPELLGKPMPIKAAMKVRVLNRRVRAELETYHEMRHKLIDEHARRDESGQVIVDETGNADVSPEFWQAFNELMSTEAPAIAPVAVDDMGDDVLVTPAALAALGALIVEYAV
jgi:hypothetical protein